MGGRLAGKTCVVTGAAQGIGRAIAERFAEEDGVVIAADRIEPVDLPPVPGIHPVRLDVTDPAAIADLARSLGPVDILVNCVGIVLNGTVLDCTAEDFDRSMDVNVRSIMSTIQAFLPGMLAQGGGAIVNIASVVSSVMAAPNRFAYATSKAAVIGLTMAVARDFIDRNIRCNCISPGTVDSPSLAARFAATGDADAARAAFIARQPGGRLGSAREIAAAALFLACDDGAFTTGSNIVVDGGMSL